MPDTAGFPDPSPDPDPPPRVYPRKHFVESVRHLEPVSKVPDPREKETLDRGPRPALSPRGSNCRKDRMGPGGMAA